MVIKEQKFNIEDCFQDRRSKYDARVAEEAQMEGAWGELASLLVRLQEKLEEAANTIRCTNCNRRHKRVKLDRPIYAARHCAECQVKHAAREVRSNGNYLFVFPTI